MTQSNKYRKDNNNKKTRIIPLSLYYMSYKMMNIIIIIIHQ